MPSLRFLNDPPMPQSAALKIDQAKKHLDALEEEVRSFLSRNPFAVVSE